MARGRFTAHIDMASMRVLRKRRRLVLDVSADDEDSMKTMLSVYERDAVKRVEAGEHPREIAFLWDVAYGKRSLGKLNLIWALETLTVRLMNEGMPEGKPKLRPVDLYNQDMGDVAPCRGIEIEQDGIAWLAELGLKMKYAVPIEKTNRVIAYVVKTLSKWDDREAHLYIEFMFNRLAMMGIPLPDDQARLKEWWFEWMEQVDQSRIDLHAEELSKEQYCALHPLCEGCMRFIGQGGGQLAHIKSVGAGGEESRLAKGSEWLHLCAECHTGLIHTKGWGAFKEKHPHLTGKIDRALGQPALGVQPDPAAAALVSAAAEAQELFGDDELKRGVKERKQFDDDPRSPIF